jgi:hypothetical protein
MEVSSSSEKIEKFNERLGTIFLKEFKATFSIVVYELEFKYSANYTEVFAFKQLARYVHYEALDVYILSQDFQVGVPKIPKLRAFATLGAHNFLCRPPIDMRSNAKLYPSSRAFQ